MSQDLRVGIHVINTIKKGKVLGSLVLYGDITFIHGSTDLQLMIHYALIYNRVLMLPKCLSQVKCYQSHLGFLKLQWRTMYQIPECILRGIFLKDPQIQNLNHNIN